MHVWALGLSYLRTVALTTFVAMCTLLALDNVVVLVFGVATADVAFVACGFVPFWPNPFWLKLIERCVAHAHNEFLCRVSIFAK